MDEEGLKEKLRRIEALHAGAATPGERDAAEAARERIVKRLEELRQQDPPIELRLPLNDLWEVRLVVALLRRYKLHPYRHKRQRQTSVMVRAPEKFMREMFWPEFQELAKTLRVYLTEITERVIATAINADTSEAEEVPETPKLSDGSAS
jgi:hypothetical protein